MSNMKITTFLDVLRKFTDAYDKREDSFIGRLSKLIHEQMQALILLFDNIERSRDINQADGVTLDYIGESRGQKRGKATDEIMRVLIKARVARQYSDGTINGMIQALSLTLNADPSTFKIKSMYSATVPEPATLMIEGLPIEKLNEVGLTALEFGLLAQEVAPAGVKVNSIELQGTFRFSSLTNDLENSPDGFSDDSQTGGGTLSATFDPDQDNDLPI